MKSEEAMFAAGCFWCIQPYFDQLKDQGVIDVQVGYAGGHVENPTYEQVSRGDTGHKEVARILFDPDRISYRKLLEVFWENIDPFDSEGQFVDQGEQYKSGIFAMTDEQKKSAEESVAQLSAKFKKRVVTPVLPAAKFFPAEGYHQSYYLKSPFRYQMYQSNSGRSERLREVWGKNQKP